MKGGFTMTARLVPWFKREPLYALQKEFDNLFERFFEDAELTPFTEKLFMPQVDIKETKKDIQITAELPGMDEKDIDVSLHEGTLIMKGEKKDEHEDKKEGHHKIERSYGSFCRAIHLPDGIDEEKVKANYRKGVLRVILPKTEKAQEKQKKIEVKAE
jgi:HSP20 family protein